MPKEATSADKAKKRAELYAAAAATILGATAVAVFGLAIVDGHGRAQDAPLRALLGPEVFDALGRGEATGLHYIGDNRTAPDFTLSDRNGAPWSLSDHRGKTIVLNFWSITCPPCVRELPTLMALARMVANDDDIEVVTVSTDSGWSEVSRLFPNPDALRMKILFDPGRETVRDKYGTRLFPETWIIDGDGFIRLRIDGERDWSAPIVLDMLAQL